MMPLENLTLTHKKQRSQWAGQFLAAAELVRRYYTVAFTMGNHTPVADLMVGAQNRQQFWVDVKALGSRSVWLLKEKPKHSELYYILVALAPIANHGQPRIADRFFVLTQDQANGLVTSYREAHPTQKAGWDGFNWVDALPFEDKWESLPH